MSNFLRLKLSTPKAREKLRQYSPTSLTNAYKMVKEQGVATNRAAILHGIPASTLRDRLKNRISLDVTKSGTAPVLGQEEEARLCNHIIELASVGYGYTRIECIQLASDYAVALGKRTFDDPFTFKWCYGFKKRWPELDVVRPSSLSEQRARCSNETCVTNYFNELQRIITKFDLVDKPQNIYNVDEKGINTEFKPPNVVASKNVKPQAIMAERSKTVTILGAGNALGHQIPPYFIFPGVRLVEGLMEGKTPGTAGVMTKSGWSNSEVFKHYLQTHFLKFAQGRDTSETLLLLYDGHKSHISLDLIDWALERNIVLFVLPPHTSHILQPMDVGCFGPLQVLYNQECTKFARLNHRVVTKYDVCSLACKAYASALCPTNLQSSFKRAGIYPLQTGKSMVEYLGSKIKPALLYDDEVQTNAQIQNPEPDELTVKVADDVPEDIVCTFFEKRKGSVCKKVTKKRKSVHNVVGGKALEGDTVNQLKAYLDEQNKKTSSKSVQKRKDKDVFKPIHPVTKSDHSCIVSVPPASPVQKSKSPLSGPSCINLVQESPSIDSDLESFTEDTDVCCVCKSFYVPRDKRDETLFVVNWVQCDDCGHWVHLKYCTPLRVARKNTLFTCDCCV